MKHSKKVILTYNMLQIKLKMIKNLSKKQSNIMVLHLNISHKNFKKIDNWLFKQLNKTQNHTSTFINFLKVIKSYFFWHYKLVVIIPIKIIIIANN